MATYGDAGRNLGFPTIVLALEEGVNFISREVAIEAEKIREVGTFLGARGGNLNLIRRRNIGEAYENVVIVSTIISCHEVVGCHRLLLQFLAIGTKQGNDDGSSIRRIGAFGGKGGIVEPVPSLQINSHLAGSAFNCGSCEIANGTRTCQLSAKESLVNLAAGPAGNIGILIQFAAEVCGTIGSGFFVLDVEVLEVLHHIQRFEHSITVIVFLCGFRQHDIVAHSILHCCPRCREAEATDAGEGIGKNRSCRSRCLTAHECEADQSISLGNIRNRLVHQLLAVGIIVVGLGGRSRSVCQFRLLPGAGPEVQAIA